MIVAKNVEDNCYLIRAQRRPNCSHCGKPIELGEYAWSYSAEPVDGNYVEHDRCRYPNKITCAPRAHYQPMARKKIKLGDQVAREGNKVKLGEAAPVRWPSK